MTRMTVNLAFQDLSIDVPFEELELSQLENLHNKLKVHRELGTVKNSARYWLTTKVMDTLEELINERKIGESMIRGAAEAAIYAKQDMEIGGKQYRMGDAVSADDIDQFLQEHNADEYGEEDE